MAWTCYVVQREQGDDVGAVTCIWDEGGPAEVSIYCGYWKIENASKDPIKQYAEAELARRQAIATRNAQLSNTLTTYLNT